MLYLTWRNEQDELFNIDFKLKHQLNIKLFFQNRLEFESSDQDKIDEAIKALGDIDPDDINYDNIVIEEVLGNEEINIIDDGDYLVDNPGDKYWINDPNTDKSKEDSGKYFNIPNLRGEDEYFDLCRKLNSTQRLIFLHTLHCFKTNKQLPMSLYIAGGAGVFKSLFIRTLYEGLVRYLNSKVRC